MAAAAENPRRPSDAAAEIPDDFRTLDFDRLWRGRDRTTEVESRLALEGLAAFPRSRVVEVGTGDGRLTPFVRAAAEEYVGVDQSFEFLSKLRSRFSGPSDPVLVEANVYHLPLVDGAASAALLARVYNFLTRPRDALEEIRRTLVGGGGLVMTCHPRPSVGSVLDDLRTALARRSGESMTSMTFSRKDVVPVVPSGIPAVAPTRRYLRATIADAGFERERTLGSGYEDFRLARRLPSGVFHGAGSDLGSAPVFPLEWEVLRNPAGSVSTTVPPIDHAFACPRCRRPFGEIPLQGEWTIECADCQFPLRREGGILRARYEAA